MPFFVTIVKDTSPLLQYSADWRAGTSESDSLMDQYTDNTFTLTQTQNASMSFSFYGSSVAIMGAKRSNHGNYVVQLDGTSSSTLNGESSTALFKQTLFSSTMDPGDHEVVVTNQGTTFFDIDYISFQTSVGREDEELIVNTYQDGHPAFLYTPPSAWGSPLNVGMFSGGSGRVSPINNQNSTPSIPILLLGDAIALYGSVGPDSISLYSVQVDNASEVLLNANQKSFHAQQIMFYAGNLGAGVHTLKVQSSAIAAGELAIDYANVYSAPSLGGSYNATVTVPAPISTTGTSTSTSNTPSAPSNEIFHNRIPIGVIAGLAVLGTLTVLSSSLCLYLYLRLRQELKTPGSPKSTGDPDNLEIARPFVLSPLSLPNPEEVPSAPRRLVSQSKRGRRTRSSGGYIWPRGVAQQPSASSSASPRVPGDLSSTPSSDRATRDHTTPSHARLGTQSSSAETSQVSSQNTQLIDGRTRYLTLVVQRTLNQQRSGQNLPPPVYS